MLSVGEVAWGEREAAPVTGDALLLPLSLLPVADDCRRGAEPTGPEVDVVDRRRLRLAGLALRGELTSWDAGAPSGPSGEEV